MKKPVFCICENKDADQRLCFQFTDSTVSLHSKPLAILCGHAVRFVLDLVGNPEDRLSHNEAHFKCSKQMMAIVGKIDFSLSELRKKHIFFKKSKHKGHSIQTDPV